MLQSTSSCVDELLAMPKFGNGIGFRRMQLLLRPLMESDWGRGFTTIRITGSNGKGSVTAMIHSILRRLEVNCGRYTSPHLLKFNERIVVRDREIADAEMERAFSWVRQAVQGVQADLPDDAFGSFELITCLCIRSFYEAEISLGIMEAGIGGRYDSTRLFPGSLVALTSIDLEHTALLGNTKELIAYEKADLCPDQGTVVGMRRDADLWDRLEAYGRLRRLKLVDANATWKVEAVASDDDGPGGMDVRITGGQASMCARAPLIGTFQLENIAVACSTAELWVRNFRPEVTSEQFAEAVVRGLQEVKWPGRLERICTAPPVFIDVGHSPDACLRLVESVARFLRRRAILLVTGVSSNKAVEAILKILVPVAQSVICTRAYHMGERVDRIGGIVRQQAPGKEMWEVGTVEEAAALARRLAESRGMTVLVAGGLFLAVEFRTAWEGSDPKQLRFY